MGANHKHVSYYEIKKYVESDEDSFTMDTLDFFEDIRNRLMNCTVCKERMGVYQAFSKLTKHDPEPLFDKWIARRLDELRKMGNFLAGNFTLMTMQPLVLGAARSVAGAVMPAAQEIVELERNEDYYYFELGKPTKLTVKMTVEEVNANGCELIICREGESAEEYSYPLVRSESGYFTAITDKLAAGRYVGIVIGGTEESGDE